MARRRRPLWPDGDFCPVRFPRSKCLRKEQYSMTKAVKMRWLAVLIGVLALALPVCAAEEAKPQPYVVLVGISDYADKQIKPRPHAEADVQALYDLFTNKDYLGVSKDNIRLLLGKEDKERNSQPATRENILKALQWIAKESKPNDLVV